MYKVTRFFFALFQSVLLFNSTKQSAIKQAVTTFKTIGKTIKSPLLKTISNTIKKPVMKTLGNNIKNSMGMFRRNKNTVKNFACGFQEKYLSVRHNIGITAVKHLGVEGIKKFKYTAPQVTKGSKQLFRTGDKKNIQMRAATQMSGKELGRMVKRSTGQMKGNDIRSLINMVSKNKPQLPFLFAAGGLTKLTEFNLNPSDQDTVSLNQDTVPKDKDTVPLDKNNVPSDKDTGSSKDRAHKNKVFKNNGPSDKDTDPAKHRNNNDPAKHRKNNDPSKQRKNKKKGNKDNVRSDNSEIKKAGTYFPLDNTDWPLGGTGKYEYALKPHKELTVGIWDENDHIKTQIWLPGYCGNAAMSACLFADKYTTPMDATTKVRILTPPMGKSDHNPGMIEGCWFNCHNMNANPDSYNFKDVEEKMVQIRKVIAEEIELLGGKSENVYIGGWEQGAAMALHAGLGYEKPLGVIFGLSGFQFKETIPHKANKNIPVFLSHGAEDQHIKLENAKKSYLQNDQWLKKKNLTFHTRDKMGNDIDITTIDIMKEYVAEKLPKSEIKELAFSIYE